MKHAACGVWPETWEAHVSVRWLWRLVTADVGAAPHIYEDVRIQCMVETCQQSAQFPPSPRYDFIFDCCHAPSQEINKLLNNLDIDIDYWFECTFLTWRFNLDLSVNALSHCPQFNFVLSSWTFIICLSSLPFCLNLFWQIKHLWSQSLCTCFSCHFSFSTCEKLFSHSLHLFIWVGGI